MPSRVRPHLPLLTRRRPLHLPIAALLLALLAPVLPAFTATPAHAADLNGVTLNRYEAALVNAINAQRTSRGLRALTVAAGPTDVARRWTFQIAAKRTLAHNGSFPSQLQAAGSDWHWVAENVGTAPANEPARLVAMYMASAPHRANILDTRARYLGVGVVDATVDGYRTAYNTLNFTDAYTTSYGRTREPADAMPYDGGAVTSSRTVASFEGGWDARLRSLRASSALLPSAVAYTGPSAADDSARFWVRAVSTSTSGYADLLLRTPLDLTRATSLRLLIATTSPSGVSLPIEVLVSDGHRTTSLGTVGTSSAGRLVTVPIPTFARQFADTVRLRLSAARLATLGSSLSARSLTVRVAQIGVLV